MTAEDCCAKDANQQFELMSTLESVCGFIVLDFNILRFIINVNVLEYSSNRDGNGYNTRSKPANPLTAKNQDDNHEGLSTGAKTGLAVRLGVGIPFITVALAAVFMWRKRKQTTPALIPDHRKEGFQIVV
jgi:hypothetical protein